MDNKGDKYGYLRRSGAIGVSTKAIAVSGSTRGKGALGSQSDSGSAERGKQPKVDAKMQKSMRGLKGGAAKVLREGHNFFGDPGDMFGGSDSGSKPKRTKPSKKQLANPKFREKHSIAAAKGDLRAAKKSGGDVGAAKQSLAAVKGERKTLFNTMKAARKDIRTSNVKGVKKAAKGVLKATKQEAKARFAGKYKKVQAARQARKKKDSGGGLPGLAGLL